MLDWQAVLLVCLAILLCFVIFWSCMSRRRHAHERADRSTVSEIVNSKMWVDGDNPIDAAYPHAAAAARNNSSNNAAAAAAAAAAMMSSGGRRRVAAVRGDLTAADVAFLSALFAAFTRAVHTHHHALRAERSLTQTLAFMGWRSRKLYCFVNDPLINAAYPEYADPASVRPRVRTVLTVIALRSRHEVLARRAPAMISLAEPAAPPPPSYSAATNAAATDPSSLSSSSSLSPYAPPPTPLSRAVANAPPGSPGWDHSSPARQADFRTLLLSLQHPHIWPTFDIGFSPQTQAHAAVAFSSSGPAAGVYAFVCRPFAPEGSLRDLLWDVEDPTMAYSVKYPRHSRLVPAVDAAAGPVRLDFSSGGLAAGQRFGDPDYYDGDENDGEGADTGTDTEDDEEQEEEADESGARALLRRRPGDPGNAHIRAYPLSSSQIARYGRQVLEAMVYLERAGVPPTHVHAGNILLHNGRCLVTDYEAPALGLAAQQQARLGRAGPHDPSVVAFAALLFELATGRSMPVPRYPRFPPVEALSATHPDVGDVLKVIFAPRGAAATTAPDAPDAAAAIAAAAAGGGVGGGAEGVNTSSSPPVTAAGPPYVRLADLLQMPFFSRVTEVGECPALPPAPDAAVSAADADARLYGGSGSASGGGYELERPRGGGLGYGRDGRPARVDVFRHSGCRALAAATAGALARALPAAAPALLRWYPAERAKHAAWEASREKKRRRSGQRQEARARGAGRRRVPASSSDDDDDDDEDDDGDVVTAHSRRARADPPSHSKGAGASRRSKKSPADRAAARVERHAAFPFASLYEHGLPPGPRGGGGGDPGADADAAFFRGIRNVTVPRGRHGPGAATEDAVTAGAAAAAAAGAAAAAALEVAPRGQTRRQQQQQQQMPSLLPPSALSEQQQQQQPQLRQQRVPRSVTFAEAPQTQTQAASASPLLAPVQVSPQSGAVAASLSASAPGPVIIIRSAASAAALAAAPAATAAVAREEAEEDEDAAATAAALRRARAERFGAPTAAVAAASSSRHKSARAPVAASAAPAAATFGAGKDSQGRWRAKNDLFAGDSDDEIV